LDKLPAVVQAHEKRLRQVLINLLGNAIKFTDSGKVTFKVELEGSRELEEGSTLKIRFQVKDTGIIIVSEELKKSFCRLNKLLTNDAWQKEQESD
jgi:signal transduction histidine kinase